MKKCHLLFSILIIVPIALAYGTSPDSFSFALLDFKVNTPDLKNIFRAIMGLYFAIAGFWVVGIIKPHYWKAATIVNILFMAGIGLGRLLSVLVDGIPSMSFLIGMFVEFLIAIWGIFNVKKYQSKKE